MHLMISSYLYTSAMLSIVGEQERLHRMYISMLWCIIIILLYRPGMERKEA